MIDRAPKRPTPEEQGAGKESYSGEEPPEGGPAGSSAGTGEVGGPEDYDDDPQAGGGRLPTHNPKGGSGSDAPSHNSR